MSPSLFSYRPFDAEIWAKWVSDHGKVADQAADVWAALADAGLSVEELHRLQALWQALSEVDFDCVYQNYLVHPLRVAGSLACHPESADADTVAIALCHNFRELAEIPNLSASLSDIERRFLSDRTRRALDRLYTDRNRERDDSYLASYYENIAVEGTPLIVLKGLDKLDNHLSYAFEEIESFHHEIVTSFVVPFVQVVAPRLAAYLDELVRYISDSAVVRCFHRAAQSERELAGAPSE